ncbi:hypothetical protein DFH08DRAFT_904761 [Mycena albidolilacea]|uniref:Uncharacterized protein n=1 Tax=Mycena albidolilacea TaxID=1033008 RepID=A0AAD6Z0E9_9AGAR|nr:hypothetical protein DFH08DRAFT_904761 [Mycena albidolilacea]
MPRLPLLCMALLLCRMLCLLSLTPSLPFPPPRTLRIPPPALLAPLLLTTLVLFPPVVTAIPTSALLPRRWVRFPLSLPPSSAPLRALLLEALWRDHLTIWDLPTSSVPAALKLRPNFSRTRPTLPWALRTVRWEETRTPQGRMRPWQMPVPSPLPRQLRPSPVASAWRAYVTERFPRLLL